jgi:UDP-sugar pyrophosphorylase
MLVELDQTHVFEKWEKAGTNDEEKHKLFQQVKELNQGYTGGLGAYIENAKKLLKSAADGENPLQGWRPEVPTGVSLEPVTPEYEEYERRGLPEVGSCGFVLVAGGLGERLGYNGIKVELPTQTITNVCYLELYCRQILTMQKKYALDGRKLPLAIMVSDDTNDKTIALLKANRYFGLDPAQISILKQGKVPALTSNAGLISMAGSYCIDGESVIHCC